MPILLAALMQVTPQGQTLVLGDTSLSETFRVDKSISSLHAAMYTKTAGFALIGVGVGIPVLTIVGFAVFPFVAGLGFGIVLAIAGYPGGLAAIYLLPAQALSFLFSGTLFLSASIACGVIALVGVGLWAAVKLTHPHLESQLNALEKGNRSAIDDWRTTHPAFSLPL